MKVTKLSEQNQRMTTSRSSTQTQNSNVEIVNPEVQNVHFLDIYLAQENYPLLTFILNERKMFYLGGHFTSVTKMSVLVTFEENVHFRT